MDHPVVLPKGTRTLILLFSQEKVHPHQKTLILLASELSGTPSQPEAFRKTLPVILQSWRGSTHYQYSIYLTKWLLLRRLRDLNPYTATPTQALDFMTDLLEQGLGYSAMNTVRSAVLQGIHILSGVSFGELPMVKQFLKGVFQQRYALPRYTLTWAPSMLLTSLKSLRRIVVETLNVQDCCLAGNFISTAVSYPTFLGHSEHGDNQIHSHVLKWRRTKTNEPWQTSS